MNNIRAEEIAIMNYKKVAQVVSCEELRELVFRIIEDEEVHIKIFTDLLNNIKFWS
jgi:bacterioferritin